MVNGHHDAFGAALHEIDGVGERRNQSVLAPKLARAVYHIWKHDQVFDQGKCLAT